MKLHSLIVDNFLDYFEDWRAWADGLAYTDEVNPVDSVSYPGIYRHVPTWGIQQRIQAVIGIPVLIRTAFLRLSPEGVHVPHQAHSDSVMGAYSLMLYLNRPEDCLGGTALVRHRGSGMQTDPQTQEGLEIWTRDMNDPTAWETYSLCEMKTNRAFIFRSDLMHCAFPTGGFGENPMNARLVLTTFFDA